MLAQENTQSQLVRVTGIELEQTESGLEITFQTPSGQRLVPLILPEGNNLVIDILDATLALPEGDEFSQTSPVAGIREVNATQVGTWNLDVLFTSSVSSITSNHTANAEINVLNEPSLTINLTAPTADPGVTEGDDFELNCTAKCTGQNCNNVDVFLLFCNDSLTCDPGTYLNTTSIGLTADLDNVNLGILS